MAKSLQAFAALSDDDLLTAVNRLAIDERRATADLIASLVELDQRRLYLGEGYSSLFTYCTQALGYPNGSAFRRISAARLLVRFPVCAEYLADGRLNLSTLGALRDVLEPDNHRDLLDRASGQSEEKVKVLAATVRPLPEVKESIRRVPVRPPVPEVTSGAERKVDTPPALPAEPVAVPAPPPPRPKLQPIDAERHSLKMTVGPEFMEALKEVKSALSHQVPDGNLETLLRICMEKTLELCARRKRGARAKATAQRPHTSGVKVERAPAHRPRTIPAEVRRAVWERDQGCCAFIGRDGKRCGSTYQLEYDHLEPYALGGEATVDGIALHCRAHNLHRARRHFGEAHMAKFERAAGEPPVRPHEKDPPPR